MDENDRKTHASLQRVLNAHLKDVAAASAQELLDDAKAEGIDVAANAARVDEIFRRAQTEAGRMRREAARVGLGAYRETPRLQGSGRGGRSTEAGRLTMAARNLTEQSERDRQTVQDDLDELAALKAKKPK